MGRQGLWVLGLTYCVLWLHVALCDPIEVSVSSLGAPFAGSGVERCQAVTGSLKDGNELTLDEDLLRSLDFNGVLECLPADAKVTVAVQSIQLKESVQIRRAVTIVGKEGTEELKCGDGGSKCGVVVRSSNVTIRGLKIPACDLDRQRAFIHMAQATNTVLDSIECAGIYNEYDGGCISSMGSSGKLRNITAIDNYASSGGVIHLVNSNIEVAESSFGKNGCDNHGGAIYLVGGELTVSESTFWNNTADRRGGGISKREGNLKVLDCNFEGNDALFEGGAIDSYARGQLEVHRTKFTGNMGGYGAAICLEDGELEVSSASFVNNRASSDGGAVFVKLGKAIISNTELMGNAAVVHGGGVCTEESSVTVHDTNFTDNRVDTAVHRIFQEDEKLKVQKMDVKAGIIIETPTGGGIFSRDGTLELSNVKFTRNKAEDMGGSIFGDHVEVVNVTSCAFEGNIASSGGAIFIAGDVGLERQSMWQFAEVGFMNNLAEEKGGAIHGASNLNLRIKNSWFEHNVASEGGGIQIGKDVTLEVSDTKFDSNGGGRTEGGGVHSKDGKMLKLVRTNFEKNKAAFGGAVYVEGGRVEMSEVNFTGNSAGIRGGSICAVSVEHGAMSSTVLKSNHAQFGGGIYLTGNDFHHGWILSDVGFIRNSAEQGGGLYGVDGAKAVISRSWFQENSATKEGGAVMLGTMMGEYPMYLLLQLNVLDIDGTKFLNNTAGKEHEKDSTFQDETPNSGGGAVSTRGEYSRLYVRNSDFTGNKAGIGGAVLGSELTHLGFTSCSMSGNSAILGGAVASRDAVVMEMIGGRVEGNLAISGGAMALSGTHYHYADEIKEVRNGFKPHGGATAIVVALVEFVGNQAQVGGGALDVSGFGVHLKNCIFDSNRVGHGSQEVAGQGGGLRITYSSTVLLEDSEIRSCKADVGGGIYVEDAVLVSHNLKLTENRAIEGGGAIAAIFTPQFRIGKPLVECQGCALEGNEAENAGIIHFNVIEHHRNNNAMDKPQLLLNITSFSGNTVHGSGPLVIFPNPDDVEICCVDPKSCSRGQGLIELCIGQNQKLGIPWIVGTFMENARVPGALMDHTSGKALHELTVELTDAFNNVANSEAILVVEAMDSNCRVSGPPATGMRIHGKSLVKGLILEGTPGEHILRLIFTSIDEGRKILEKTLRVEVRGCGIGEIPTAHGWGCELCARDSYNFDLNKATCKRCPDSKARCEGSALAPTDGFWHSNSHSDVLYPCLNSKACAFDDRTARLLEAAHKNQSALTWDNGYPLCNEGYEGVLCGSCTAGYGRSSSTYCIACKAKNILQFLAMPLSITVLAVVVIFFVKGAYRNRDKTVLKNTLLLPTISVSTEDSSAGYMWRTAGNGIDVPISRDSSIDPVDILKILVNFLQVTIAVMSTDNGCQNVMLKVLKNLGWLSGMSSVWSYFALSCGFNGPHGAVRALALSALVPFMVWLGFVAFGFARYKTSKSGSQLVGDFKIHCLVSAMAIASLSYIGLTQKMVQIFNCKSVHLDTEKIFHWAEDTGMKCFHQPHVFLVAFLGIPLLVGVSIGFPMALFVIMYCNRYHMHSEEMRSKYGHLYIGYHYNFAYWELAVYARKAAVALISVLSGEFFHGMFGGCLTVLVVAAVSQAIFTPFKHGKLNKMELISLFISVFTFLFGSMACTAETDLMSMAMIVMSLLMMIGYVSYMIYEYVRAFGRAGADEKKSISRERTLSRLVSHRLSDLDLEGIMDSD